MDLIRRGEGPLLCSGDPRTGRPCTHNEVDGLGHCLWHMPDDLLEEAEAATGWRRCRHGFGDPGACHAAAVSGTEPPRCKNHGANQGSVLSKRAAGNVVEGRVTDRLGEIMAEHGERLLNPPPVGNPLTELLSLAAEMAEWKRILAEVVAYLFSHRRIREAHGRVGEQLRAEVLLFERAQERLAQLLIQISRLGIEARLAQIDTEQAKVVDGALVAALTTATSGLPDALIRQENGRQALRRELAKAARRAS